MSAPVILILMTVLFLFFGYLGVPVAFSLLAGVIVGAMFTDVSLAAIVQKFASGPVGVQVLAIGAGVPLAEVFLNAACAATSALGCLGRGTTLRQPCRSSSR